MNNNKFGSFTKLYITLSLLTFVIFMMISTGSLFLSHLAASPYQSMKGLAAAVSSRLFVDMMAMEVPMLKNDQEEAALTMEQVTPFLFRYLTKINPADPKSIIALEVPGISNEQTVLLRSARGSEGITSPIDYAPPREALQPSHPIIEPHEGSSEPGKSASPESIESPDPLESVEPVPEPADQGSEEGPEAPSVPRKTDGVKAFIYHSHNRESWLPELNKTGKDFSEAFDDEINITLLGKRMAEKLEDHGIGAISSDIDYPTEIEGYNWNFSYKYSMEVVQEAVAANPELEYFFDIHRDAQAWEKTTVEIDGVNYAQVYFVIGHRNPNWEKNEAFAAQIHERLEEEFPGISRGIWGKNQQSGHGEYNQSISPNSILIEVGGPENTLEESYRTIDVLSDVIAEIFWDAREVDAPLSAAGNGADNT